MLYATEFVSFTDTPSVNITEEHVASIGHSVTIRADIESCPPVESVTWEKMDFITEEFKKIDITEYSGSNMDPRQPKLVIRNAAFKDRLYYRLTICNALGKFKSKTVFLKLQGGKDYNFSNTGN